MPALQAWNASPEGIVDTIEADAFKATEFDIVNDAVLCRNNAPLVSLFFSLLRKGVPVHIEGRDFMQNLLKLINRWARIKTIGALTTKLEDYKTKECEKAIRAGKEEKAGTIADMVDSILAVSANMSPNDTIYGLSQKLNDMFVDEKTGEKKPTLTLTTSHKAKGREWNRVFWYGKNLYNPSKYARQDWQVEQENNLMGVAATRAKRELILVNLYE
jgi:superfamily I DNA/RNA helicase